MIKRYEKYRPSGIEWIGEIPEHWEVKRFKILFSFSRGLSITKENLQDEGVPCVNYGEIHSRLGIELDPKKDFLPSVNETFLESSPNSLLKKGDFIFADTSEDTEGSGNFTFLNSDVATFAGYHTIIAKPIKKFEYKFIAHFFDSIDYRHQIRSVVNGTKVFSITQSILKNTNVLLPPIPEQTAISNYLDEKTAQIEIFISKKQKLIELLKEERAAIINKAMSGEGKSWRKSRLKYVAQINPSKRNFNFDKKDDNNVIFLPMEKVSENGMINQDLRKKISEVSSGFTYFEKGDVLIAKITPCFENGKGALLESLETDFGFGSTEFHTLRATDGITKQFLFYLTRTDRFMQVGEAFMTGSAGQKRVPSNFVEDFVVGLPSLKEQQDITLSIQTETRKIDNTISKIEMEIELMQEYRTVLISEVITGKIKVI